MNIAQISDTHIALDTSDGDQRMRDFARTIADINALDPPVDVILHSGDLVQSGHRDEYAQAVAILERARAPVYIVPGNRDNKENLRAAFSAHRYLADNSEFIDYAIEDNPVRLIALDTATSRSNKGGFGPERARRLTELIAAETTKPIAVFMHHPPFEVTEGPDQLHFETPEMLSRLKGALQDSGRVLAVFCGHVHRAAIGRVGSVRATVAPCTATTRRYGDYPPSMKSHPVYQVHRFDPIWGLVTETRIVGTGPSTAKRVGLREGIDELSGFAQHP